MLRKKIKLATSNEHDPENQTNSNKKKNESSSTNDSVITSPFFDASTEYWRKLYDVECRMSAELKAINFLSANISAVYNPIEYAADLHCAYMKKFLNAPKPVLFIGMNPGPFGMVQTGVNTSHWLLFNYFYNTRCK